MVFVLSLARVGSRFPDAHLKDRFDLDRESCLKLLDKYLGVVCCLDGGGDWQEATVKAGDSWVCPEGLYEVYVYLTAGYIITDLNDRTVASSDLACWFPFYGFMVFTPDVEPIPISVQSKASHGWIMSGDEGFKEASGFEFVVHKFSILPSTALVCRCNTART